MYLLILTFVCLLSLILNGVLYFAYRRTRFKLKKPVPDITATQLMNDLMSGGAIAVTQVIDPRSILLMSPRDYNA